MGDPGAQVPAGRLERAEGVEGAEGAVGMVGSVGSVGAEAEGLEGLLLREVRRQALRGPGPDVGKILGLLHEQTGAHVALVAEDAETVEAATRGFPRRSLRPLAALLGRLSGGQLAAAATQVEAQDGPWTGTLHVRCEALGPHEPRPVLVVAGSGEPTPRTVALTSHTAGVLSLLRRAGDSDRSWHGYQHKARQLRFAVLQALLAGDALLARRMTTGAVPPLLEADRIRLHLLHCAPGDRDRIARAEQDPSGYHGPDLMVQCPVFKDHLICLVADDEGAEDAEDAENAENGADTGVGADTDTDTHTHTHTDQDTGRSRGCGTTLHRLVRDNPRYALGVSGAHPLTATAAAYSQAAHALAAARTAPGRVAHYHGRAPLEGVLPRRPALDWARTLLAPLQEAPKTSVDITHLAMSMPRTAVARLLDLSRNTVTAHLKRAEQALGCDLGEVRSRAAVHLALALTSSCAGLESDTEQPSATLDDLLYTERAAAWAHTLLRPLKPRHLDTLHAWIDANADAQRTARSLGISRNTVRAHLRTVEAGLGLDLLTLGTGVHDIVHALHITRLRAG